MTILSASAMLAIAIVRMRLSLSERISKRDRLLGSKDNCSIKYKQAHHSAERVDLVSSVFDKSDPHWLFILNLTMVGFFFGAMTGPFV